MLRVDGRAFLSWQKVHVGTLPAKPPTAACHIVLLVVLPGSRVWDPMYTTSKHCSQTDTHLRLGEGDITRRKKNMRRGEW